MPTGLEADAKNDQEDAEDSDEEVSTDESSDEDLTKKKKGAGKKKRTLDDAHFDDIQPEDFNSPSHTLVKSNSLGKTVKSPKSPFGLPPPPKPFTL